MYPTGGVKSPINSKLVGSFPIFCVIVITYLLLCSIESYSQPNKRTNHWFFSDYIGLDFSSGVPVEDTSGIVYSGWTSTSTMSDTNGNLLFYSNASYIWNKNHENMAKSHTGPTNWTPGHQGALAVPAPGSDSLYYIFTARFLDNPNPMHYYTINVEGDNGFGEQIHIDTLDAGWDAASMVTGNYHKNKKDIWIVTRKFHTSQYAAFLVNEEGVNPEPVLSPAPLRPLNDDNMGNMKISYDKKYLVVCFFGNGSSTSFVEICKFNNETGVIEFLYSFQLMYVIPGINWKYKTNNCEFSPCSKYLYIGATKYPPDSTGHIYQFDMSLIEDSVLFFQSAILISEAQGHNLQLAPDGKIYCFTRDFYIIYPFNNFIGIIHEPGKPGLSCNFQPDALFVTHGLIDYSFVNFFPDFLFRFDFDGICESDTFTFDPWFFPEPDFIQWNFGDPASGFNNISTIPHATHKFTDGGSYEVSVHVEYPSGRIEETSRVVEVEYAPEPDLGPDTTFCFTSGITLDAECGPHIYTWSTGAFGVSQITVFDTGWYWVRVENSAGCFETDSIHLTLHPPATADTTNLEVIPTTCGGSTGVIKGLVINGMSPFSYQWLDDLGNPISASLDIYHLPVGNYTLEVTDGNNCVTSFGPYTIVDAGDVLIEKVDYTQEHCGQQDASITVTAVSGLSDMLFYSIDNGTTYYNNQGLFTGLSAGIYAVRVRDSTDCQCVYINNPIIIQNTDAPEISDVIIGPCASGQSNGFIEISAIGGGDTIYYSNDNGLNFQINDGGFYNLVNGFYTCVVMDEVGCDTTFIVEVPEEITIRLQAVAGDDEVCPGITAFVPLTVSNFNDVAYFKTTLIYNKSLLTCTGFANAHTALEDSLEVMLFPAEGKIELLWHSASLSLPDNTSMADLVFQSFDPGLSMVNWDGSTGASLFQNSTGLTIPVDYFLGSIKIYEEVFFTLGPNQELCQGDDIEVTPMLWSSNGDVNHLWTGPDGFTSSSEYLTINNAQQHQSGTYSLRITDTLDCYSDDYLEILVHPSPVPDFSGQDTISTEVPVEIDAGAGHTSYNWTTGETSQFITAVYEGWYGVFIESLQGCYGGDSVYVLFTTPPPLEPQDNLIFVPNAFSPNEDGLNDEFKAITTSNQITSFHMYIYNRWGEQIFESSDISQGWDGEFKGQLCPAGAYVYKIDYSIGNSARQEVRTMSGTVVLIQ